MKLSDDMRAESEPEDILLSVIIPSFNEASKIGPFLEDVQHYLKRQSFRAEIIVIDDASTDATHRVLDEFGESHPISILRNDTNSGKGYSVRQGVKASSGKHILFMDADSAYTISSLNDFLEPLLEGKCDITVGNRRLSNSRFVMSPKYLPYVYARHLLGQIFNLFTKMVVLSGYTDTQCGYKCFRREAAVEIFGLQRINGFCFDVEILFLATKLGYRCQEVPVTFYYDGEPSSVRLFPDAMHFLFDLVSIRINNMLGRYEIRKGG